MASPAAWNREMLAPLNAPTPIRLVISAEQSLIGALLQKPDALASVRQHVTVDLFEDDACRIIYQGILDCVEIGDEVTALTVAERLEKGDRLEKAGGFVYLIELAQQTLPGSALSHARMVAENGQRRGLARIGERLIDAASKPSTKPVELARLMTQAMAVYTRQPAEENGLLLDYVALRDRYAAQEWAVKGIIPQNAVGMFFGASGTFKSFIALDYALHRCYGLPWLGRRTVKGIPVYIAAEGGAGLYKRINAWHRARNLDPEKMPMRVVILPLPMLTEAARLRETIEALQFIPSDIIIDTMSQTFVGEENSSTEVANYLRILGSELREPFGATVLVVHHTGHSATDRPRGSSAIIANCDFLYGVFRDEAELLATMECVKQKDDDRAAPVSFALRVVELGEDRHGDPLRSLVARHAGAEDVVAQAKQQNGATALSRLISAIGYGATEDAVRTSFYNAMGDAEKEAKRQAYNRALKRAEAQGLIRREGDLLEVAVRQYGENRG
jgi:hypothetical protein